MIKESVVYLCICCDSAKSSAVSVEACPGTETEWNNAAQKKNCSSIPQNCSSIPLVYHCVPNHFLNATYEVCAAAKFIFNGRCTEYNVGGGVVQGNFLTNCRDFNESACPSRYKSTETFQYQGCYQLVVRTLDQSTTQRFSLFFEKNYSSLPSTSTLPPSTDVNYKDEIDVTWIAVPVTITVVILAVLATSLIAIFVKRRRRKQNQENETPDSIPMKDYQNE
ncbi:uncharacterized protein LOC134272588 [Saccostrea cucullata]|uniref:uncharacterized protein LOC134272588 n=1 Tax=Saccostrea cuccullata TaxID=36930 RepID=UPI002ED2BB6C